MFFLVSVLIGAKQTDWKKKKYLSNQLVKWKKKQLSNKTEMKKIKNTARFSFHINIFPKEQS